MQKTSLTVELLSTYNFNAWITCISCCLMCMVNPLRFQPISTAYSCRSVSETSLLMFNYIPHFKLFFTLSPVFQCPVSINDSIPAVCSEFQPFTNQGFMQPQYIHISLCR